MAWGLKNNESANLNMRTQWYAFIRLWFLLAIAVPGILSLYLFEGWSDNVRVDIGVVIVAISSNLLLYGFTKIPGGRRYHQFLAGWWICLDVLLITLLIFVNGGIESRSPILYAVPVLISAALFGRRGVYATAAGCTVLYTSLIILDYQGVIHSMGAFDPTLRTNLPYVINTLCFFPAVLGVIALAVDFITTLLFEKQREVKDTISALETAQEIAKVGSWEWDIKRDEITWSKELFHIYGLKPTSRPFSYAEYLHMLKPDEAGSHRKTVLNAMKKKISFNIEHELELPDGSIKYLHGEGRPVHIKNGRIVKMSGTLQDVTEIYHLDMAKREFVSLASHQLRTPASGVKAFLSLLMDGHAGDIPRQQRRFIKQAYDANVRQLEIIDNLLSLASIESGKLTLHKERIDIQDLIKRALPSHHGHIKTRKQRLRFTKLRRKLFVLADPGALQMALDNLLSNASKYTPDRGAIDIAIRTSKSSLYLDIKDTGIGITKKDLSLLFQKFSRLNDPASRTVGGSGLGLYMAKYIIELHGGRVLVSSRHGVGTTFTIKLPLSPK